MQAAYLLSFSEMPHYRDSFSSLLLPLLFTSAQSQVPISLSLGVLAFAETSELDACMSYGRKLLSS